MAEEQATANENEANRELNLQKIYIKDISFESPQAPAIFTDGGDFQPQVNMNLSTEAKGLGGDNFEVTLSITVTLTQDDKTLYLAEVQQAGLFTAKGFPEAERGPLVGIYCPNILFPYAREAISDVVTRGGFPQFLLAPVNFEALYAQQQQQQSH